MSVRTSNPSRRPAKRRVLVALGGLALGLLALPVPAGAGPLPNGTAWGFNADGQLGNGTTTNTDSPTTVPGVIKIKSVSTGDAFSLALLKDGTVRAWGLGIQGELGNGTMSTSFTPVTVSGLTGVAAVSAGGGSSYASLALLKTGTVEAWGYNGYGQLGDGTFNSNDVPGIVPLGAGVKQIAVGGSHDLALMADGTVASWGRNGNGELGYGTVTNPTDTPVVIPGLSGVKAIAAGIDSSYALLKNGTVMSWGDNSEGELGDGNATGDSSVPVPVPGLTKVKALTAGGYHVLALLKDGTAVGWGSDSSGELGDGNTGGQPQATPVAVSGLTGIKALSAGQYHSLALLKTGAVYSWGSDANGALGLGSLVTSQYTPQLVTALSHVKSISAGDSFSLAST